MELTCCSCGKRFPYNGDKKLARYCPGCRDQMHTLRYQRRDEQRRAAKCRNAILHPGPAHQLDLNTVLQALEQFNALRRAEGRSSISYGRYVAMRDGYIQISDSKPVVRQPPDAASEKDDQETPAFRQQKRRECDGKEDAA